MNKYLDESFSVTKLTTELGDNNAEFYFLLPFVSSDDLEVFDCPPAQKLKWNTNIE